VSTILHTKNWEKGSMARRIVQFVYFQCLMYVADAKYTDVRYSIISIVINFPFYLPSSTTAKNSSGMFLNLLSILDLTCFDQVPALYHV
jgi:hypothetical protein